VFGSNAHYLDQKSLLETHLVPFFGEARLPPEITIEDVERLVAHVKARPGVKGEAMSAVRVNKTRLAETRRGHGPGVP
jgi:hypothetical protein